MVRELKSSGHDVKELAALVTSTNEKLMAGDFKGAIECLNSCLNIVEKLKND